MSRQQWGHGYHNGVTDGVDYGMSCGEFSNFLNRTPWHTGQTHRNPLRRNNDAFYYATRRLQR